MFKRHLTVADYFIIAANLIPLYGVLFLGWQANIMFLVYCLETVIIGIFHVFKMAAVMVFVKRNDESINFGDKRSINGWPLILFFIVHYGLFVFVQTQIFFHTGNFPENDSFIISYSKVLDSLGKDGQLVLLAFIFSYAMQTVYNFIFSGQYRTISMNLLMFQPYGRIFIQQFVVVMGSMFLTLGGGKIFMIIFVTVKIIFEVYIDLDRYILLTEQKAK